MDMFRRIFFAAVLAGAVAGLALGVMQQWRAVPLILHAELFEGEGHSHAAADDHAHPESTAADHSHAEGEAHEEPVEVAEPWAPADGWERTGYTILATTLAGLGFIFVIAAVSIFTGLPITTTNSALWGLGGFITFALAPAFGLPPELPGMVAADLGARQVWWWGTVLATGAGIIAFAKFRTAPVLALAVALIVLPHLVGAPQPPDDHTEVPAHLAAAFASAMLTASMVYWLLGTFLLAWFNQRFNRGVAK